MSATLYRRHSGYNPLHYQTQIGLACIQRPLKIPREHFGGPLLPAITAQAGDHAARRFIEFFTATIRNANTRRAYAKAVGDFLACCHQSGFSLPGIEPVHVATYIEQLTKAKAAPTVKQHLAAISMLFDWLTSGSSIAFNPAASVRGPKYRVKRGKTPVLTAEEARRLLDSINTASVIGLRDRKGPVFRSIDRHRKMTSRPLTR